MAHAKVVHRGLVLRACLVPHGVVCKMHHMRGSASFKGNSDETALISSEQLCILLLFVGLTLLQTMPSSRAAHGLASLLLVTALRRVMSTARWAPRCSGRPATSTSMHCSSSTLTPTFMSQSLLLARTVAQAPLHVRASAFSGTTPLVRNRPECGQVAQWRPLPTLASRVRHRQRQPQSFQDQGTEVFWIHREVCARRTTVDHVGASSATERPQVSLVAGT